MRLEIRVGGILGLLFFYGCGLFRATPTPMHSIFFQQDKDSRAETLIVFLPGRHNGPEEFEQSGFIEEIRSAGIKADAICLDAHLGYYYRRTFLTRLREDVIAPARQQGYRSIWLVGVSMGGLGCLQTIQFEPTWVDGILAIAPFLGDDELIQEIKEAGGIPTWVSPQPVSADDYQRQLWLWIKREHPNFGHHPRVFLGYGLQDSMVESHSLLAKLLPPGQVFTTTGGHTWAPWLVLFKEFLAGRPFDLE